MKIRSLAAIACVTALCACNSNENNSSGNSGGNSANASGGSTSGNSAAAQTNSAKPLDPQLAQELTMAVQMAKGQLPMTQQTKQGEVKVTNIEASGGQLIYTMEVPTDLDQAKMSRFQTEVCGNPQMRQLMDRGASYTYRIRDNGGENFETTVSRC